MVSARQLFPTEDEHWERRLRRQGFTLIAGVDEVGRGCIAGPVVAAAVVLRNTSAGFVAEIDDSKKLRPERREAVAKRIRRHAVAVGIGVVDNTEIDKINILQASFKAMRIALAALGCQPGHVLVDGHLRIPECDSPQTALVQGDGRCKSIGAASIIAKVYRDDLMRSYDAVYPAYRFAANKGYGTREHWEALVREGPCPLHRLSFQGVAGGRLPVADQMVLVDE
jgi:ribonuclease HII